MVQVCLFAMAFVADAAASVPVVEVPEPSPLAQQYHYSGQWVWAGVNAWSIGWPMAFAAVGLSARLRDGVRKVAPRWVPTVLLFSLAYLVLDAVVSLPVSWYVGFQRPHSYGLSDQAIGQWLLDRVKSMVVFLVIALPVISVTYALIARFPRRWWLVLGSLSLPFLLFMALIKPIWIDPVFNDFGPMRDKALEARLLRMADRAGIEGGRVYEVDKSRETRTVNAYVTGFLDTKRIVLWDTLLNRLDDDEVAAVMAHEMGHYVLGHVVRGLVVTSALMLLGLFLVDRLARWVLRISKGKFGFEALGDIASLPLLIALGGAVNLALTPVGFAYSRQIEHEADRFGLDLTHDNVASARAFVTLQQTNLGYPRPGWFYTLFRGSHPSLGERIDFANGYRPWVGGSSGLEEVARGVSEAK